jgi:hypothetical protein
MDMRSRKNRAPVAVDVVGRKSSRGRKKNDDADSVAVSRPKFHEIVSINSCTIYIEFSSKFN